MEELKTLAKMFVPDKNWISREKEKHQNLFFNKEIESLPISFVISVEPPLQNIKFNLKEQFEEKEKMAFEQLREMVMCQNSESALLPSIRANLGTGFIPSIFGAEQQIYEDKMPWVQTHPSKEKLKIMEPSMFEDISKRGLITKAESIYLFYKEMLGTNEFCYIPDTQGILDIAHLVRGHELLYDVYDDPGFVHHLMELCLTAYINVTKYLKKIIGEPLDGGMHEGMALYNGGVRYCMDTSVLFSRQQVEKFEIPYLRRALKAFGGGFVHFCGYAPHLVDLLAEIPEVRGINPNYMDSKPYDYERDINKILKANKFFIGAPFKNREETIKNYFRRVVKPLSQRKGLNFCPRGEGFTPTDSESIKELWETTQKEMLD